MTTFKSKYSALLILITALIAGFTIYLITATHTSSIGRKGHLLKKRVYHSMTALPDGKVLVWGGDKDSERGSTAEVFDPVKNKSSNKIRFPYFGSHEAIALQNGDVLIIPERQSNATLYDFKTATLATVKGLHIPRDFFELTRLETGQVLVTGGCKPEKNLLCETRVAELEIYDPVRQTFSVFNRLNNPLSLHQAFLINKTINLVGWEYVEQLRTDDKSFQKTGMSPFSHDEHVFGVDGKIVGFSPSGTKWFDPLRSHVITKPFKDRYPDCEGHTPNFFRDKQGQPSLFITCGETSIRGHDQAYIYNFTTNTFRRLKEFPAQSLNYSYVELRDGLLFAGGQQPNDFDSDAYIDDTLFIRKSEL